MSRAPSSFERAAACGIAGGRPGARRCVGRWPFLPRDFDCCAGGSFPYDEPIVEALPGAEPDLWEGDQA